MDGFLARAKHKRKAIIDAAEKMFASKGYRATTMKGVAREAVVSPVTIYNYFGSKERLLYEVAKRLFEKYAKRFETIVYDSSLAFKDKMEAVLKFELDMLDEIHDDLLKMLYTKESKSLRELGKWYTENRTLVGMQHLIREGKKEGAVASFIDEESLMAYIELFRGISELDIRHDKKRLKDLMHMFFYGIGGKRAH